MTTHWTVVLNAGRTDLPQAAEALEKLCRTYWYPLYLFVRRQGYAPADAEDLTQGFFARLIERRDLEVVRREKGRFRGYLLVCLKHFMANEWKRGQTLKRGGRETFVSIDQDVAEERYKLEPAHDETPEKAYDRRWALTVLDQVRARLRAEYAEAGKARTYDLLRGFLAADGTSASQAEIAQQLDTTEGTVKQLAHRMRRRYRELIREEIGQTVATPAEIEAELRHFVELLRT
jgi:RNA polymerase sigma factor (sigma-70 family)